MKAQDLWGAWTLKQFQITFSDNREPLYPFGQDAQGQILYTPTGQMSAILSRRDRPQLAVSRLESAGQADTTEKAAAFDSYLSYGGTYTLEGDQVTHHVAFALVPNILGARQVRQASLSGDRLTLSYEITARSGVVRRYQLDWRRCEGSKTTTA